MSHTIAPDTTLLRTKLARCPRLLIVMIAALMLGKVSSRPVLARRWRGSTRACHVRRAMPDWVLYRGCNSANQPSTSRFNDNNWANNVYFIGWKSRLY